GDIELTVVEQTEISGAQIGAIAVGSMGLKLFDRLVATVVVPAGNAFAAQPDLADAVLGQLAQCFGVDNPHVDSGPRLAGTHQADRPVFRGRVTVLLEGVCVGVEIARYAAADRGKKRYLGHAVPRSHC